MVCFLFSLPKEEGSVEDVFVYIDIDDRLSKFFSSDSPDLCYGACNLIILLVFTILHD